MAPSAQSTIVQTAVAAGEFKTLVSLVKQAGLAGALSGPGPLMVFAPTDAAFAAVPKATLAELAKSPAKLKAVLLNSCRQGRRHRGTGDQAEIREDAAGWLGSDPRHLGQGVRR